MKLARVCRAAVPETQPPRKSRVWILTSRFLRIAALRARTRLISGRMGMEEGRRIPLPHLWTGWALVAARLVGLDIVAPLRVGWMSENDGV